MSFRSQGQRFRSDDPSSLGTHQPRLPVKTRVIKTWEKGILPAMPMDEAAPLLTLREVLDHIRSEIKRERRSKARISHELAQRFLTLLKSAGARVLEVGKENANYFVLEVEGRTVAISPFSSHEEWWEKPSKGFRSIVARRSCEWGVVLFFLREKEGVWIEGSDFDASVLKGREKVNSGDVEEARRRHLARPFRDAADFLRLVTTPTPISRKSFLLRKTSKTDS